MSDYNIKFIFRDIC